MAAFDDAKALLLHAAAELPKIRKAYDDSLHSKTINSVLLVEIKNFVENLRSSLDFAAHGLHDRNCGGATGKSKIYFPYAIATQSRSDFANSGRINACIPGLPAARPDIEAALLEMQHFGTKGYKWLPSFMDLTNENKHQRLTPQVRKESKELRISGPGGAGIALGPGAGISLGKGASISIGGAHIPGGQTFDANNPPVVHGGRVEIITWVSFHFDSNNQQVLPFIETAFAGVSDIVNTLEKM